MKLAFSTLGCPDWSIERVVDEAARLGYAGIELRLLGAEIIPADLPAGERRRIRRLAADAGLAICCVACSARFAWAQPAERTENEQLAARYLELAVDLGSPFVRVFGGHRPADQAAETVTAYVAASLQRLGERAAALGPTVVLETHDDFSAGATVAATLALVDSP